MIVEEGPLEEFSNLYLSALYLMSASFLVGV